MIPFVFATLPISSFIMKLLKIPVFKPAPTRFFINLITETLQHRIQTGAKRNDMVDLMVEAIKNEGSNKSEKNEHEHEQFEKDQKFDHRGNKEKDIDELTVVATATVILVAGNNIQCLYVSIETGS